MTPEQRAAHERLPRGRVVSNDDPMTDHERRAEAQRKRAQAWHRRQNSKPAPDLSALMEFLRP